MLRKILIIFTVVFLVLGAKFTLAEESSNSQEEDWNPPSAGPIVTWTAPHCGKNKLVVQPFFFYNRTRGTFDSGGKYIGLGAGNKKYQYQQQLFMQYGLTEKFEIDAQTVYQENHIRQDDLSAVSTGLGDSYMFMRYCALEDKGWIPALSGIVQIKFPTGKYQNLDPDKLGTDAMGATADPGAYDQGLGLNLSKKIKPFIVHTDFIYSFPNERKINQVKTKYAPYLNYDIGIEYFLPKGFNVILELNGLVEADKIQDGNKVPGSSLNNLVLSPAIGWSSSKLQTLLAYQRVLNGSNVDANDSVVITAVYTF